MQIWVYLNGIQQGPYSLDQIRLLPLTAETPVWYQGLAQWTPAAQAPATAGLFGSAPAQVPVAEIGTPLEAEPRPAQQKELPPKPSTYLVWNILFTVLCCCPVSIAGIITGALSTSRYSAGDYEGAKRMSDATQWLLIIGILWVILFLPVSILFSLF